MMLFVLLKIPEPAEAKLTPVWNFTVFLLYCDIRERYGGGVGTPTFSAATFHTNQTKLIQNIHNMKDYNTIKYGLH